MLPLSVGLEESLSGERQLMQILLWSGAEKGMVFTLPGGLGPEPPSSA